MCVGISVRMAVGVRMASLSGAMLSQMEMQAFYTLVTRKE